MQLPRFAHRSAKLPYLVIALFAAVQLALVAQPFSFLLTNLLPDDAFYYFQIARNITEGSGSTFDGSNMTNGYHPLWMVVLLPIFSLLSDGSLFDVAPIYSALYLSVTINVLTLLVVLRLLSRLTQNGLVQAIAIFVLLSPLWLFETVNGLETAIALLFTALFFLYAVKIEEGGGRKDYLIAGVLAGLMVLARLDMAIYALALALWFLIRFGFIAGVRRALLVGGIALLVASPWFIFNYLQFGMVLTSASNGNVIINHALVALDNGRGILVQAKGALYLLIHHAEETLARSGAAWLVFMLFGGLAALLAGGAIRMPHAKKMPVLLVFAVAFGALFLINIGFRFTGRTWYFVSGMLFVALLCALVLEPLFKKVRRPHLMAGSLIVALSATFLLSWYFEYRGQMQSQAAMLAMAEHMTETLPPGTPVGVFNAGVQGYFSNVQVINLDGLVNNEAYEAIHNRRLWTYIEEEGIAYISDFDLYIEYRYRPFLNIDDPFERLREIRRIGAEGGSKVESIALYELLPAK